MVSDLQRMVAALQAKAQWYDGLFQYYDGTQPLVYSTERLREVFRSLDARFSENWCAVVVDSVLERLVLRRFAVIGDREATELLNRLWITTEMDQDCDEAHLATLVTGEAFVVAWLEDGLQVYYNDPRMAHIIYDHDTPKVKRVAGKWWSGDDGLRHLVLYYPDRLEEYSAPEPKEGTALTESAFKLAEQRGNPWGMIPMFHLRRTRRAAISELANAIPLQDAVNKLLADMMVAAEFGAFRQRYVISNADVGALRNAPNEIWSLPAGDGLGQGTTVGEFAQTDLNTYVATMDKLAAAIGVITRTPKHFFFMQAGDPSGEALIAMEAPLTHKAERYVARFAPVWQDLGAFMLRLMGVEVDPLAVKAIYQPVGTIQPLTQAQIRQTNVATGIPLRSQLRSEGWAEDEIAQVEADAAAARMEGADLAAAYVEEARKRFDQEMTGHA